MFGFIGCGLGYTFVTPATQNPVRVKFRWQNLQVLLMDADPLYKDRLVYSYDSCSFTSFGAERGGIVAQAPPPWVAVEQESPDNSPLQ